MMSNRIIEGMAVGGALSLGALLSGCGSQPNKSPKVEIRDQHGIPMVMYPDRHLEQVTDVTVAYVIPVDRNADASLLQEFQVVVRDSDGPNPLVGRLYPVQENFDVGTNGKSVASNKITWEIAVSGERAPLGTYEVANVEVTDGVAQERIGFFFAVGDGGNAGTNGVPTNGFEPACDTDADCGSSGFVGEKYCNENKVVQDYKTNECRSPGTKDAHCHSRLEKAVEVATCANGCLEGACLEEPSEEHLYKAMTVTIMDDNGTEVQNESFSGGDIGFYQVQATVPRELVDKYGAPSIALSEQYTGADDCFGIVAREPGLTEVSRNAQTVGYNMFFDLGRDMNCAGQDNEKITARISYANGSQHDELMLNALD